MTDRASDLAGLAEHLTAAHQLGIRCELAHELATFPLSVLRKIVASVIEHEAPPMPASALHQLPTEPAQPHEDTRRTDARQDRDQT